MQRQCLRLSGLSSVPSSILNRLASRSISFSCVRVFELDHSLSTLYETKMS